jgi:hypothetical protein
MPATCTVSRRCVQVKLRTGLQLLALCLAGQTACANPHSSETVGSPGIGTPASSPAPHWPPDGGLLQQLLAYDGQAPPAQQRWWHGKYVQALRQIRFC